MHPGRNLRARSRRRRLFRRRRLEFRLQTIYRRAFVAAVLRAFRLLRLRLRRGRRRRRPRRRRFIYRRSHRAVFSRRFQTLDVRLARLGSRLIVAVAVLRRVRRQNALKPPDIRRALPHRVLDLRRHRVVDVIVFSVFHQLPHEVAQARDLSSQLRLPVRSSIRRDFSRQSRRR